MTYRGQQRKLGVLSARNWTKFWTKFITTEYLTQPGSANLIVDRTNTGLGSGIAKM
jgi:hypothetical protein